MNEQDVYNFYVNNKSKFIDRALTSLVITGRYQFEETSYGIFNKINKNIFDEVYKYLSNSIMIEGVYFKNVEKLIIIKNISKLEYLIRSKLGM